MRRFTPEQRRRLAYAGILAAGAAVGLGGHRWIGTTWATAPSGGRVEAGVPDASAPLAAVPTARVAGPTSFPSAAPLPVAAVTPPPDPFEPTPADPLESVIPGAPPPAMEPAEPETPPPPTATAATLEAAPVEAAPMETEAPAPRAEPPDPDEEFSLVGVVRGDPSLAVVRWQGQTLFLKPGDTVADRWRLVEIKERSAVFQSGERRAEVAIQGGSTG